MSDFTPAQASLQALEDEIKRFDVFVYDPLDDDDAFVIACPSCSLPTMARLVDGHVEYGCAKGCPPQRVQLAERRMVVTAASAIRSEKRRWLWRDRVPLRGLTAIAGEKAKGKSLLTNAHLAAKVTRGELQGELYGTPVYVLIVTAEDSWQSEIKPRLIAAGADLDRVVRVEMRDADGPATFTLPDDVGDLAHTVETMRMRGMTVGMIVIDPIGAFLGDKTDSHKDASVRRALAPLADLAERLQLAVVVVMHLNKDTAAKLLHRVSGSGGFVNAARAVLHMVNDPDDPDGETGKRRLIVPVAGNWSDGSTPTLAAHIETRIIDTDDGEQTDVGFLVIDGESSLRVDDLQGQRDEPDGDDVEEAILAALADGERPSADVKKKVVGDLGCVRRTVERAAHRLAQRGELTIAVGGFPRRTTWSLPVTTRPLSRLEDANGVATAQTRLLEPNPGEPTSSDDTSPGRVVTGADNGQAVLDEDPA